MTHLYIVIDMYDYTQFMFVCSWIHEC